MTEQINKVVLAYSGGLDTSVIVRWLQDTYGCEVVTFTADIGQGEEVEPARAKAEAMGIKEIYIDDLREEFVRDFVFPMFRANTVYEGEYLLGTSIARPLIAKRLVEIARETGADAIELNLFIMPSDINKSGISNEEFYFDTIEKVKKQELEKLRQRMSQLRNNIEKKQQDSREQREADDRSLASRLPGGGS